MPATILIVEDENIVAQDLQMTLEDLGYKVPAIVDSGELALQKAAEIQPNLILMDIRIIGEMDGITTAQIIAEQFEIPVVYMTAHSNEATFARVKKTSSFGYIIKPFNERELRTIIEIALYKHFLEKRSKENTQWLTTTLQSIGDGVIATDLEGCIKFLKFIAENLTGWSFKENEKVIGAVLFFCDVTEQRLTAQKLHRQAFYDDLTNLPNRAWFKERLADAIARVQHNQDYQFAVLFLDIDRFKVINDSLGHAAGDCLLFHVTHRLLKSIRAIDRVARLGGDEFAIFLENLQTPQEVDLIAQRIGQELKEPFNLEGQEVYTNASIGIVFSSIGYYCVEDILRDADIAMYRAKAKGKGCYEVFYLGMRDRVVAASQLENDLRYAIEKDELDVYYQPIISLSSQKIKGFEALVRWHHPERGLVPPAEFIPIAEEIGLIIQLDMWVLQQACRQMKIWQEQYPETSSFSVSVNISSQQFKQPNLIQKIEQILTETSLASSGLELEIIESALIDNPELAAIILEQLKELGVGLSLDDFGTGYSSLSYLHRFPVNAMKIDRSFLSTIDGKQNGLEIIRTIIMLGHSLGIDVVAEGIETQEQLTLLQKLQCLCGQGYFFSQPLSASEGTVWLKSKFGA